MEKIPTEWVDKIFNCMTIFYGERWTEPLKKPQVESFNKLMWRNGLIGLTYDEIKNALKLCKRSALDKSVKPPHVMEFFRYAKKTGEPYIDYHPKANDIRADPQLAKDYLRDIKSRL